MKLKKAFMYFISFFSLAIMFTACYYLSYKNALNHFNENAIERNNQLKLALDNNSENPINQAGGDNTNESKEEADLSSQESETQVNFIEDKILPSTRYTLQTYDVKTGVMDEEALPTPSYLVGLNRADVIQYLNDYMQDLPLNEFEKGLVSFDLLIFSPDGVVLRKTYDEEKVEYKYYLKAESGYIVAYYGDKKTVFDYTGISVEDLPEYDKKELEDGILVKNLDELYALLENYSS